VREVSHRSIARNARRAVIHDSGSAAATLHFFSRRYFRTMAGRRLRGEQCGYSKRAGEPREQRADTRTMGTSTRETIKPAGDAADQTPSPERVLAGDLQQPQRTPRICLEVPVTVRGAQGPTAAEGLTRNPETFHEETLTVIVFSNGAVVRLSARVTPGQTVVVTNQRTSQELACRVVSVRTYREVKGYAELEFTQDAPSFWGFNFPPKGQDVPLVASWTTSTPPDTKTTGRPIASAGDTPAPPSGHFAPVPISQSGDAGGGASLPPKMVTSAPVAKPGASGTSNGEKDEGVQPAPAPLGADVITSMWAATVSEGLLRTEVPSRATDPTARPDAPSVWPHRSMEGVDASEPCNAIAAPVGETGAAEGVASPSLFDHHAMAGDDRPQPNRRALILAGTCALIMVIVAAATMFLRREPATKALPAAVAPPATSEVSAPLVTPAPPPEAPVAAVATVAVANPNVTAQPAEPVQESDAGATVSRSAEEQTSAAARDRTALPPATLAAPTAKRENVSVEPPPEIPGGIVNEPAANPSTGLTGGIMGPSDRGESAAPPLPPARASATPLPARTQLSQAHLISSVLPTYPPAAKHGEGDVVIDAVIDTMGNVTSMKVVSGPLPLRPAAMDALRRWKYAPATLGDQPVPQRLQVIIKFRAH
jgi:TonB family protein